MYQNKEAFTLIELLVVVLIIGILAAVALPQYKLAVAKSSFSTMKHIADALMKAEDAYYLANGKYTKDMSYLDVDIPGWQLNESESSTNISQYDYDWGSCKLVQSVGYIKCELNKPRLAYVYYLQYGSYPGFRICQIPDSQDTTDWRNKVCSIETNNAKPHITDTNHINRYYHQ